MKKNYVKPGKTVSIKVADCFATRSMGIAGSVQAIKVALPEGGDDHSFYGTLVGMMKGNKPITLLLTQLGFYYDPQGIYYLTFDNKKI